MHTSTDIIFQKHSMVNAAQLYILAISAVFVSSDEPTAEKGEKLSWGHN